MAIDIPRVGYPGGKAKDVVHQEYGDSGGSVCRCCTGDGLSQVR